MRHLFSLGPAYTRGERSGELIGTTVEGVEALDPYVSQYLPQVFLSIIVPTIMLIVVFRVDVPSGIILLIMAPLLPFLMAIVGMMAGAETKRRWRALRLMSAHFLDVLQGLTTLKLFGRSETEEQQVRENLLIARPNASQEEVEAAARQANIHKTIEALPQGYDTVIGEQGLKLSGGERQRLAIARVLLKDAPLMIFDEATAHLDTCTEREVIRAIHQVMQGRTILILTHRLVGLEMADEIVVLQSGRIKERGTQPDLLQAEGIYWKLWQLQNQMVAAQ